MCIYVFIVPFQKGTDAKWIIYTFPNVYDVRTYILYNVIYVQI